MPHLARNSQILSKRLKIPSFQALSHADAASVEAKAQAATAASSLTESEERLAKVILHAVSFSIHQSILSALRSFDGIKEVDRRYR